MRNKIIVDNKLIENLSKLSKLRFDEKSLLRMKADLTTILGFVDKISKVDTKGIKPLIYMSEEKNILREDKINHIVSQSDALKNAPQKDSDYFKVPTVLKK
jgi:aspartyl-tRNA(Asn)/glutamyl-tRNA(Gln) amidotransferase subunit C